MTATATTTTATTLSRKTTPMPTSLALSTTTTTSHRSNAMQAAIALEPTNTFPTLTLVEGVPANSNASPPRPFAQPVEEPLRASRVNQVAAEEIAFFFTSDADNDNACAQARAVIASRIAALDPRHQDALALHFDLEPWPESIEEGLDSTTGYALVLSNASARAWRRHGRRSYAEEQAADEQLREAVLVHGPHALRYLTRRAEFAFASAVRPYAKARGRAPAVLPCEGCASTVSEAS
jgi:hypothetical protein